MNWKHVLLGALITMLPGARSIAQAQTTPAAPAEEKHWSADVGIRRYKRLSPIVRGYVEGSIGIAFVDAVNVVLVGPQANLTDKSTDFYDRTAAFTLNGNAGLAVQTAKQVEMFGQWGLRRVSGMSAVDGWPARDWKRSTTTARGGRCLSSSALDSDSDRRIG